MYMCILTQIHVYIHIYIYIYIYPLFMGLPNIEYMLFIFSLTHLPKGYYLVAA